MKSIAHLLLVSLLAFAPAMAAPRDTAAPATLPPGVAIASGHELATDAGLEIPRHGGNAFDAAVAVSSTPSVVEPISPGLGGGGFFLLHLHQTGQGVSVDAREPPPPAATQGVYPHYNDDSPPP